MMDLYELEDSAEIDIENMVPADKRKWMLEDTPKSLIAPGVPFKPTLTAKHTP